MSFFINNSLVLQHYAEQSTFFFKDCSRFIIHYSSRASLTNNPLLLQHYGALSLRVSWKSEPSSSPRFRNSREYSPLHLIFPNRFECDFLQFFYSPQFVLTHFGCVGTSILYTSTIGGSHFKVQA